MSTNFELGMFKNFCMQISICHAVSSPYNHQKNGQTEIMHKICQKNCEKKCYETNGAIYMAYGFVTDRINTDQPMVVQPSYTPVQQKNKWHTAMIQQKNGIM